MRGMVAAGLVLVLVLLAGCAQQPVQENTTPPPVEAPQAVVEPQVPMVTDCDTSADCFLPHLRACTPAKARYVGQTTTKFYEITGVKDQYYCNVHLTTVSLNTVEEDCVAPNNQEMYGSLGYYKNERDIAYFELKDCTNRKVL